MRRRTPHAVVGDGHITQQDQGGLRRSTHTNRILSRRCWRLVATILCTSISKIQHRLPSAILIGRSHGREAMLLLERSHNKFPYVARVSRDDSRARRRVGAPSGDLLPAPALDGVHPPKSKYRNTRWWGRSSSEVRCFRNTGFGSPCGGAGAVLALNPGGVPSNSCACAVHYAIMVSVATRIW